VPAVDPHLPLSSQYEWPSAIVTGGGSGLGQALALMLARDGLDVFVWGRTVEKLEETTRLASDLAGSVTPVGCDVSDPEQVDTALIASTRDADVPGILVNNAAGAFVQMAEDISPNGWHAVLAASLHGVFLTSRAWCRSRVENATGGVILNVTSATTDNGSPGTAHSGAAKAGVTSLTKSLAMEWSRWGIRVNAIAPGAFTTGAGAEQIWTDDSVEKRILESIPLGRFANVEDIAEPARFLLSRGANYITGTVLKVDGGWTLNKWLYRTPAP
jgi:NAD(P)-dependent dehydrogenase (short-subunit alcohol dehydrogenase family)